MRKLTGIVLLLLASQIVYGSTTSLTAYTGFHVFGDTVTGTATYGIGPGFRGVVSPQGKGFYLGGDLYAGFPVVTDNTVTTDFGAMYFSLKFPLGHRWPGAGKRMGFDLGAGPEFQVMSDFTYFTEWYFSIFIDFGWQTNRTEGVGFHFGIQLSICPYKWSEFIYFFAPVPTFGTVFQFGVSWRRTSRG